MVAVQALDQVGNDVKNTFDSRNRNAGEIVGDLRALKKKRGEPCLVAVLGSHAVNVKETTAYLRKAWPSFCSVSGISPARVMTGCADVGAEKAVRVAAKQLTGKLSVVIHRADYMGVSVAEVMRDTILANEADALLILTNGGRVCRRARELFVERKKPVYELNVTRAS